MHDAWLLVALGCSGCGGVVAPVDEGCEVAGAPVVPTEAFFTDISAASGVQVDNFSLDPAPGTAINDHSRLAFADLDGDGLDDIVMHSLFPNPLAGVPFEHLVFRNLGDGTFEDITDASGLRELQVAFFAFADVDNDGDQDLFGGLDIQLAGESSGIWLNDGAARFSRLVDAGVEDAAYAGNATFADFDGDALVDLFVGAGGTTYAARDGLYRGLGGGRFEAVHAQLSGAGAQPTNGSIACDLDNDGDADVVVSTYSVSTFNGVNQLWVNDGSGDFADRARAWGFAAQTTGNYWLDATGLGADDEPVSRGEQVGSNGFGLDCGDVDGDGDLDVIMAAISHPNASDYQRTWSDPSQLLINEAGDLVNVWQDVGLPYNEGDVDVAFVDFDNDGRLDISLSRDSKYEGAYDTRPQHAWFGLFRQREDGSFDSMGYLSGINDPDEAVDRMKGAQNHAWSDIDADGDVDLLVGGRDQGGGRANFLFRNDVGQDNAWASVRVQGDGIHVSRDAFGTRLTLTDGDALQLRELKSSRGTYNSEDTRALRFSLASFGCDGHLEVTWTDGTVASLGPALQAGGRYVLRYPDVLELR